MVCETPNPLHREGLQRHSTEKLQTIPLDGHVPVVSAAVGTSSFAALQREQMGIAAAGTSSFAAEQ